MRIRRVAVVALGVALVGVAISRHRGSAGRPTPEGILITDHGSYERLTGWLLGGFYGSVASDVGATAGPGSRVLEVGCGPGHLAERLVEGGFEVTATDLDPAMVERAERRLAGRARVAVADVASLPLPDASFDVVVSTLSLHHWADPAAGAAEIARVLRPDGRALVFDLGGVPMPLHGRLPDPASHFERTALRVRSSDGWPWPGPLRLVRRVELVPA